MNQQTVNAGAQGLSLTEQDAFSLSQAAVMLDQARSQRNNNDLAAALDHNMELWVAIRTLVSRSDSRVPASVRDNLVRLSNFVAQTTLDKGIELPADMLDSLININLQISEGLLEGRAKAS
jgi:flagellar biosynthesis regulator FlaF